MIRAAVKIAYLGENFTGSQIQPGLRTVEGDVLSDITAVTKMPESSIDLKLASRTDRGVNALGNVAVFNCSIDTPEVILKALNGVSKDIFYRSIATVGEDFNPRFADMRYYRYILRSAGMNVPAMRECAALFTGEHDFTRFCKTEGKSALLFMESAGVREEGGFIILDFSARYFLWNMIRRMAAAMMSVGRGDHSLSDVKDALEGKDISFGLARPDALTLMDIRYENVIFTAAGAPDKRAEEEIFGNTLKGMFFASL